MTIEQKNIIQLIVSQEIDLAIILIRSSSSLQYFFEQRYMPVIKFFGGKTLRSLKSISEKIRVTYRKDTKKFRKVLKIVPLELLSQLNNLRLQLGQESNILQDLCWLPKLQHLHISFNNLTKIPDAVFNLSELKILQMNFNNIKELTAEINKLENLRVLEIGNNKLQELPVSIGDLKNLEVLNLASNQLSQIPESIKKLKDLKKLYILNNPLEDAQKEHLIKLLPDTKIYF